jgi:hypothetical protein
LSDGFFNAKHVTSTGATVVSINPGGILHGIVYNQLATNAVTASTGLITVYDSTTTAASSAGSVIGIIGLTAGIPEYVYDCIFQNGLTIQVGSGVTPVDLTVLYR